MEGWREISNSTLFAPPDHGAQITSVGGYAVQRLEHTTSIDGSCSGTGTVLTAGNLSAVHGRLEVAGFWHEITVVCNERTAATNNDSDATDACQMRVDGLAVGDVTWRRACPWLEGGSLLTQSEP